MGVAGRIEIFFIGIYSRIFFHQDEGIQYKVEFSLTFIQDELQKISFPSFLALN